MRNELPRVDFPTFFHISEIVKEPLSDGSVKLWMRLLEYSCVSRFSVAAEAIATVRYDERHNGAIVFVQYSLVDRDPALPRGSVEHIPSSVEFFYCLGRIADTVGILIYNSQRLRLGQDAAAKQGALWLFSCLRQNTLFLEAIKQAIELNQVEQLASRTGRHETAALTTAVSEPPVVESTSTTTNSAQTPPTTSAAFFPAAAPSSVDGGAEGSGVRRANNTSLSTTAPIAPAALVPSPTAPTALVPPTPQCPLPVGR